MTANKINALKRAVKEKKPLIHCITNPISIHACANAVLALGARPIMAEHPKEVCEITKTARALMLNLGNITDARLESMGISAETAQKNNIPFVIDVVGIACSELRRNFALGLTEKNAPAVIKGNYSEINALFSSVYRSSGVDADSSLKTEEIDKIAVNLAKKYNTTVLASGKTDIVASSEKLIHINNGSAQLGGVTGTGCMQGAICACFLAEGGGALAAAAACAVLGICGEKAETQKGSGTFFVNLLDALSVLSDSDIENYLKTEEIEIDKV